jgi:hypothetical protein
VDEKIVCTLVQKEVNLSSLHNKEEKEITKLFHIKVQIKKTKVDALFNSGSQANIIAADLISNIGLEVHDDAGASLTSSEPVWKTKDSWADPAKFLKFPLKLMRQIYMRSFNEGALV